MFSSRDGSRAVSGYQLDTVVEDVGKATMSCGHIMLHFSFINFLFLSALFLEAFLLGGYKLRCYCLTWVASWIIWDLLPRTNWNALHFVCLVPTIMYLNAASCSLYKSIGAFCGCASLPVLALFSDLRASMFSNWIFHSIKLEPCLSGTSAFHPWVDYLALSIYGVQHTFYMCLFLCRYFIP